jgi:heme-degrading monooxygenase HmoA
MFTWSPASEQVRSEAVSEMHRQLVSLIGTIPGLRAMSLEQDLGEVEGHQDLVLISDHDDLAALASYQSHDAHLQVASFIRSVTTTERHTVDFEISS